MGSRRLGREVRRQTPGSGGPKQNAAVGRPPAHHGPSASPHTQRLKELQSTLGNQKLQNILEKRPDPVSDPSQQEAMEKVARQEFLRVVEQIPTLQAYTSQLMAVPPGPIETSPLLSVAVQGLTETTMLLQQLDLAIEMYERAGRDIVAIRPIVAIRAQLSTLIFYFRQICAGVPLGPQAQQTVMEAILEGVTYQQELTLEKAVDGGPAEQGPPTQGDEQKKNVLREMLRRLYLGPPGLYPSAKSLKSG